MTFREERIKRLAFVLGFDLVGIAPAEPADGFDHLRDWLAKGFAGEMNYLHRHAAARRHPASILPEVRSVVMVGMNYKPAPACTESFVEKTEALTPPAAPIGKVARYARGTDYHIVLRQRLKRLLTGIQAEFPQCRGRGVVDTAPLLERDFARRAGLGWFGKNTMLLNKRLGSYFFLGALLLNLDLQPDPPQQTSHCGSCTACLESCPTSAFVAPYVLDARRCISYLTIELRGTVPEELRGGVGEWIFGCDVCQEVCPWNRKSPVSTEPMLQPRSDLQALDPIKVLSLSEADFDQRFRGTAITRAQRCGLVRNAALVLGNTGGKEALPALKRALDDPEPEVREAAAWAIRQINVRLAQSSPPPPDRN